MNEIKELALDLLTIARMLFVVAAFVVWVPVSVIDRSVERDWQEMVDVIRHLGR